MRKKAFSLIELLIALTIFGTIVTVTSSVFATAMHSYRLNIQKSFFQKDLNFTLDSIANNTKSASLIPASQGNYQSSANTLILAVSAKDQAGNFVYTANVPEYDYYIYYLSGSDLHKRIYGNANGILAGQNTDSIILDNVGSFTVSYNPDINNASGVTISLGLSRQVYEHNVSLTQQRTVNLRNKQP